LPKIDESILGNEIIVGEGEQVKLVIFLGLKQNHAFPLLVQETCILSAAVVNTKTIELRVDVEVEEVAVFCWCNVGVEYAS
jgi:hypothetical protein